MTEDKRKETDRKQHSDFDRKIRFEDMKAGGYSLAYFCLLIPRSIFHDLTDDLADRLSEWLPQICVASGWQLEYLVVRPEYLQWLINVPPQTFPGYLMRIIRQQTSERIFTEFPHFKGQNSSGDFWAPQDLIVERGQSHPPQLINDYVKQVRQQQARLAGDETTDAPPPEGKKKKGKGK